MGGRLLGQPPASGFSQLAWGQEGCCSPRRASACAVLQLFLLAGARNLHVEIKISIWGVCPSHWQRSCSEVCVCTSLIVALGALTQIHGRKSKSVN